MKKWTILFINHNSEYYFEHQLKILYKSNNPDNFELLIIDNSQISEVDNIISRTKKYSDKFGNIKVLYFAPKGDFNKNMERDEHGESVNFAMDYVSTKYLLIQDPDFFWVKNNYLDFLEGFLEDGSVAVGAPYPSKAANGPSDFPASFGCAYLVSKVCNTSFMGEYLDEDLINTLYKKYPTKDGFGYPCDMGYKIRIKLSKEQYTSFSQKRRNLNKFFGQHSITKAVCYLFKGEEMAFHLFGGSREPKQVHGFVDLSKKEQEEIFNQWKKVRFNYAQYFYIRSYSKVLSFIFILRSMLNNKLKKLWA